MIVSSLLVCVIVKILTTVFYFDKFYFLVIEKSLKILCALSKLNVYI